MAQSDSQLGRSPPSDPPTVLDHDLYGSSDAEERRTSANSDSSSGTRTVLHRFEADGPAATGADLENQQTVISRRQPASPLSTGASLGELAKLLEGEQLGDYMLDEFVGGGGMGAVFRGTDLELGRTVAVKVLSRDQGADPEMLRRFKNEAQSAARLDHDNIARVFFVGEQDGWNFIVFEFIEGVNIRDLVEQRGPLPLESCIEYAVQVAEALEHAAERDVVHRDIKPSNVLVTPDGRAKLVDMGLARFHQLEAGHSDLTASGVTLGTFDYISPEQASDPRQADVRSDLYSLGCTLFFMLTGRAPFPHGTVLQKLLAHSGEAPPDPGEQRPDLPAEMTKIIFRLLAKRPNQRYQQPREFISDMLVLRDRLGCGGGGAAALAPHSQRLTWRERLLTVGAPMVVLLLVFLGLDAYWSRSATNAERLPGFHTLHTIQRADDAGSGDLAPPEREISPEGDDRATSARPEPKQPDHGTNGAAVDSSSEGDAGDDRSASTESENGAATTSPSDGGAADNSNDFDPSPAVDDPEGPQTPGETKDLEVDEAPPGELPKLRKIVIGDPALLGDQGPHARIFSKLSTALASDDFRENLEHIDEIEIRRTRLRVAAPLRIKLPPQKHLTIRGVAGGSGQPALQFTLSATDQPDRDRGMIEVEGGKLSLENLHVQMRVDPSVDRIHDVALMRIPAGRERPIEISKCVLTIDNPPSALAPSVAFFDIVSTEDSALADAAEVRLNLNDCILRGQATVIRMRQSAPLNFYWNNGLLATSQRLLIAQGAAHDVGDRLIRLSLLHVTAEVGKGLCLLRDSAEQPNQPGLALVCNKSIICAGRSALVEHAGMGDYETYHKSLFIGGASNVYEDVVPFWAVSIENIQKRGMDWPAWKDRWGMGDMPSSVDAIGWARLRSDVAGVAFSDRSVADYVVDADKPLAAGINSGEVAGLKAESLPALVPPPSRETTPPAEPESLEAT